MSGLRDRRAHRGGQAEAHRAQAARLDPAPRLGEVEVLRRPHLVLADVGREDAVALVRGLVERLDEELRLDLGVGRVVVAQRVLGAPAARSAPTTPPAAPGRAPSARYSVTSRPRMFFASPTIGMCAGTFLEISAGSMSMWMNFARGANSESLPVIRSSKRAPIGDDQVGLVHRVVGGPRAVHAEHARATARAGAGNAPRPISVQVTGQPVDAARARAAPPRRWR